LRWPQAHTLDGLPRNVDADDGSTLCRCVRTTSEMPAVARPDSLTCRAAVRHDKDVGRGTYDIAELCENGHLISDTLTMELPQLGRRPQYTGSFCERCGARTINACQVCGSQIRGRYIAEGEGITLSRGYRRPAFCAECGSPYPWTRTAVEEFKKLAELADDLTVEQREQLGAAIDDLVANTPGTNGAVARMKLLTPKVGTELWQAMRQILVDVASEAAKKQLGL